MLRLYGDSESGNCLKPKWTAQLLGIAFEWIETSVLTGQTRTPDFLKLNPAGQAPVAVLADGRVLAQSNAIIVHLAEGSRLIPADAYDRAKMFEWLFWEQYSHEPVIAVRRFRVRFQGKAEAEIEPHLLPKGKAALAHMDLQLARTPFLVGEALSLADIALVAYTRVAHEGGFELADYPNVRAWVARVAASLGLPPVASV